MHLIYCNKDRPRSVHFKQGRGGGGCRRQAAGVGEYAGMPNSCGSMDFHVLKKCFRSFLQFDQIQGEHIFLYGEGGLKDSALKFEK